VFRHHGGLQISVPVPSDGQTLDVANFPKILKQLLASALNIFNAEQRRLKKGNSDDVPILIREFTNYACNKEPFHSHMYTRDTKPLKWWTQISKDSGAQFISVSLNSQFLIKDYVGLNMNIH